MVMRGWEWIMGYGSDYGRGEGNGNNDGIIDDKIEVRLRVIEIFLKAQDFAHTKNQVTKFHVSIFKDDKKI